MAAYQARHAPRHAKPRQPLASTVTRAVMRPAVGSSLGIAVVATATAGMTAHEPATSAGGNDLAPEATARALEVTDVRADDVARLAADRNDAIASRSAVREEAEREAEAKAKAEEAKAEAKAQAEAEKAEAEAEAEAARQRALEDLRWAQANPRLVAQSLLGDYGFSQGQWPCLEQLWIGESSWDYTATNLSSGAYGIPQSLPASKMASAGSDWRINPTTQIRWGLNYIQDRYGTPCNALAQWQARYPHWY